MTNRQYLESLSDYECSKLSIIHHMSTEPMYYMTSDSAIFEFTNNNKDESTDRDRRRHKQSS